MVNDVAGYSIELGESWKVRQGTSEGILVVDREGTDAALAILAKQSVGDLASEYQSLREALLAERTGYRLLGEEQVELGRVPARLLVTENTIDGQRRVTHNWIAVANDTAYVIGLEVPREREEQLVAESRAMLGSLVFFARRAS
jgi:hypothetical protein